MSRLIYTLRMGLIISDYDSNAALDTYSQADIDDREDVGGLTVDQRRKAEEAMRRRDAGRPSGRARRRENMPAFLASDDAPEGPGDGLLSGVNVRRRRRQYDERMEEDDVEEDVSEISRLD